MEGNRSREWKRRRGEGGGMGVGVERERGGVSRRGPIRKCSEGREGKNVGADKEMLGGRRDGNNVGADKEMR